MYRTVEQDMLHNARVALEGNMHPSLLAMLRDIPLSERVEQVRQAILKYPTISPFYMLTALSEDPESYLLN